MDNRNSDNSEAVIEKILAGRAQYRIISHEFDGFGHARTVSLNETWNNFPESSHVMIADPDWRPDVDTLNKSELEEDFDVYRFTVFDRNGFTSRQMDWLLRNKGGLRMRYHLHEVLDIGSYTVKKIGWVIREIEQPGTWHEIVGHGNSFGFKRYHFDLSMLSKDLAEYGHDPHVHYYLGITHHAVVEKGYQQPEYNETVLQHHLAEALRYLELRVISQYKDEFLEERWASMLVLGALYSTLKNDFVKAQYWLTMCRDYNPHNTECSFSLTKLYVGFGAFELAFAELENLLTVERRNREMLNHFKEWDCDIPAVAVTLFGHLLTRDPSSPGLAKYLLMLKFLANRPICLDTGSKPVEFSKQITDVLTKLPLKGKRQYASEEDICSDAVLRGFILNKNYQLHPCSNIAQIAFHTKFCKVLDTELPPAYEDYQINSSQEFVGSAIIPDIIHHVFNGVFSRVLKDPISHPKPFQVLFAEYFSTRNVVALAGTISRLPAHVAITVVTPSQALLSEVINTFRQCGRQDLIQIITFENRTLTEFIDFNVRNKESLKFDFIELNGGVSFDPAPATLLADLSKLLTVDGVIGLTYFTENIHYGNTQRLLQMQNRSQQVPFSNDPTRLVRAYLQSQGLSRFISDSGLINFLSGNPNNDSYFTHKIVETQFPTNLTAFSRKKMDDILISAGMVVLSRVPTAFAHPYGQLRHADVLRFHSLGVSEDEFVYSIMPSFRNTVYVSRSNSSLSAKKSALEILSSHELSRIVVVDRTGVVTGLFQDGPDHAKSQLSVQIGLQHYAVSNINISFIAMPNILPGLSLLGDFPTVLDIMKKNEDWHKSNLRQFDSSAAKLGLFRLLSFLESVNMISFWISVDNSSSTTLSQSSATIEANSVGDVDETSDEYLFPVVTEDDDGDELSNAQVYDVQTSRIYRMRSMGFPEHLIAQELEKLTKTKSDSSKLAASSPDNTKDNSFLNQKVARMRAMGYPEHIIAQAIEKEVLKMEQQTSSKKTVKDKKTKSSVTDTSSVGVGVSLVDEKVEKVLPMVENNENQELSTKLQAKISKMRKLGFPEEAIEELIAKETNKIEKSETTLNLRKDTSKKSHSVNIVVERNGEIETKEDKDENSSLIHPSMEAKAARMRSMGYAEDLVVAEMKQEYQRLRRNSPEVLKGDKVSSTNSNQFPGKQQETQSSFKPTIDTGDADSTLRNKAARMREMGFSEEIIANKLGSRSGASSSNPQQNIEPKASSSSSSSSSSFSKASARSELFDNTQAARTFVELSYDLRPKPEQFSLGNLSPFLKFKRRELLDMGFEQKFVDGALKNELSKLPSEYTGGNFPITNSNIPEVCRRIERLRILGYPEDVILDKMTEYGKLSLDSLIPETNESALIEAEIQAKREAMQLMKVPQNMIESALELERRKRIAGDNQLMSFSLSPFLIEKSRQLRSYGTPEDLISSAVQTELTKLAIRDPFEYLKQVPDLFGKVVGWQEFGFPSEVIVEKLLHEISRRRCQDSQDKDIDVGKVDGATQLAKEARMKRNIQNDASPAQSSFKGKAKVIETSVNSKDENQKDEVMLRNKAARMREMGFSEEIIASKLEKLSSKPKSSDHYDRENSNSASLSSAKLKPTKMDKTKEDKDETLEKEMQLKATADRMREMGFGEEAIALKLEKEAKKLEQRNKPTKLNPNQSTKVVKNDVQSEKEMLLKTKADRLREMGFSEEAIAMKLEKETKKIQERKKSMKSNLERASKTQEKEKTPHTAAINADKAERMRKAGFPEKLIEEAMNKGRTQNTPERNGLTGFPDETLDRKNSHEKKEGSLSKKLEGIAALFPNGTKKHKNKGIPQEREKSPDLEPELKRIFELVKKTAVRNKLQSREALLKSNRNPHCISNQDDQACAQKVGQRRSSSLLTVSPSKIVFDIAQLQFIMSKESNRDNRSFFRRIIGALEKFRGEVNKSPDRITSLQTVRLLPNDAIYGLINRAVHLEDEPVLSMDQLVYDGALRKLGRASAELTKHDFLVIDVIIQPHAMKELSNLLLSSTIWFDSSNGVSFVSHCDDGLIFHPFADLAKLIASALTESLGKQAVVSKYFAVNMDSRMNNSSPVMMGNPGEYSAVIWMNPSCAVAGDNGDGLHVLDSMAASHLFSQGISHYKTVHPDFLSTAGSVSLEVFNLCPECSGEFIQRQTNRMVIVSPRLPFVLTTGGSASLEEIADGDHDSFQSHRMIAFVVIFSQT